MNNIMSVPKVNARELNQGGTSTSETVFTSDGTIPVVLPLPSASQLCSAAGAGGQKPSIGFKVIATGRVFTNGTYNVTVKLLFGVSATVGSDTAIATTGVVSCATANYPWRIEATLVWDATSNKIGGWYQAYLNTTIVAPTVVTNVVTGADPDGNGTQGFVVSGTFGTGHASNLMYLDWFVLIPLG